MRHCMARMGHMLLGHAISSLPKGIKALAITIWYPALNPTNAHEELSYQIADQIGSVPPLPTRSPHPQGQSASGCGS